MTKPAAIDVSLSHDACRAQRDVYHLKGRTCPKCEDLGATAPVRTASSGAAVQPSGRGGPASNRCAFGHSHDSKGEATCCPLVHEAAFQSGGLVVFRPGKPGIPCFTIDPHVDTWRPVYVSADWLIVNGRRPALLVDYKGSVAKGKRHESHGGAWERGKRILETELGVRCLEIRDNATAIELVKSALRAKE